MNQASTFHPHRPTHFRTNNDLFAAVIRAQSHPVRLADLARFPAIYRTASCGHCKPVSLYHFRSAVGAPLTRRGLLPHCRLAVLKVGFSVPRGLHPGFLGDHDQGEPARPGQRSPPKNAGEPRDVPRAVGYPSGRLIPDPPRHARASRLLGLVTYTLGSAAAARRSIMWSTSVPPSHIEASAIQAVDARVEAPETPAPIEHPPASMAPNPISTAPSR